MAAETAGRLLWAVVSDRFFADRRASGLRVNAIHRAVPATRVGTVSFRIV